MTNPAKDDEALVERVAREIYDEPAADGDTIATWLHDSNHLYGTMGDGLERVVDLCRVAARAAIAAVRAYDAGRGMVTVPREPTPAMLNAGLKSMADGCVIHSGWCWDAMIAAAKPEGDAARDMTAAERLRMERETAAVHRAFDAVFAPRHSQWKGDK